MKVIITSPSLDTNVNVGGISSVTSFILENNQDFQYSHFEIGKKDKEKRDFFRLLRLIKSLINWLTLISHNRDAIIHYNFALCRPSIMRDPFFMLFARLFRIKLIIHLHGGEYLMKGKDPFWISLILNIVFSFASTIIVLSEFEKQVVKKKYMLKNVVSVPNCINLTDALGFKNTVNKNDRLTILFLGRITESKGLVSIYDAMEILNLKGIKLRFIIAGQGNLKDEYIPKFRKLLNDNFEYRGIVSGDAKINLIKECDIFLLPSIFGEGLPIALLETMSFGLVPIVTEDGSMGSHIKSYHNGIIVEKNDCISIATAIEQLHNDRILMREISIRTKKYLFDNFNPKDYIKKLNSIYQQVCSK
jgi:glycosyltransferase involved in cell wall biosynthesis